MRGPANLRHIGIVGLYSIRFAVRTGGGLVFLLLLLLTGISVGAVFVSPVEAVLQSDAFAKSDAPADAKARELLENEDVRDMLEGAVSFFTDADEAQAAYLVRGNPALLSTTFILLLFLIPVVTCFGAFNQTAGDIGSRGLRYVLLRTERTNIYLGRFLGSAVFSGLTMVLLVVVLAVYIQFKLRVYAAPALWWWTLQGWIAIYVLGLAYVALCSLVSALMDSAFAALAISVLLVIFPPALLAIAASMLRARGVDVDWLSRLLPWGWKYDLLSHDPGTRLLAFGVVLAFGAVFLLLGLRIFRKRDL